MIERNNYLQLWSELSAEKPIILVSGPRQSGKTTLAHQIQKKFTNCLYFNWDIISDKRKLIESPYFFQGLNRIDETKPLIIFDEIHKYKQWKNYLKGVYDEFSNDYQFLVTGSGRLDLFNKGGDSMAGRYFLFHIFPFTVAEFSKNKRNISSKEFSWTNNFMINDAKETAEIWNTLFNYGGFPEPFIKNSRSFFNKWANSYIQQVIRGDIRDMADIKNIDNVELLYSILPSKVGAPFSYNSAARDIQVSFDSIKSWMSLFEKIFLAFKISPWTKKIARSILKEKKWYLFNYAEIPDEGARFENMVALELLRIIWFLNESGKGNYSLHYIRNKEQQEVDFLIARNNKPEMLVEAKFSDDHPSKELLLFQNLLGIPAIQLVHKENIFKVIKNNNLKLIIVSAQNWLSSL